MKTKKMVKTIIKKIHKPKNNVMKTLTIRIIIF